MSITERNDTDGVDGLRSRLVELERRADALEERQDLLDVARRRPRPTPSLPVVPAPTPRHGAARAAAETGAHTDTRRARPHDPAQGHGAALGVDWARRGAAPPRTPRPARPSLNADLLGGRVLAWVGAVAVLVGVLLFLALAVSRGWLGHDARTLVAGLASLALLTTGVWLHERRGRTDAAVAAVGSAVAALFATLVVAARVYGLIPGVLGVALAVAVGAIAATLAVRWARPPVAALGIVGALVSPVLVGAAPGAASIGILWVASAAAVAVLLWQRWDWLAVAVLVCGVPQWAAWLLLSSPGPAAELIVPSAFGLLGLGAAIGYDVRARVQQPRAVSIVLFVLNALTVSTIGYFALRQGLGPAAGKAWLAALGLVHVAIGLSRPRVSRMSLPVRRLALVLGVMLADLAFGLSASGLLLAVGWSGLSVACATLRRRAPTWAGDRRLSEAGLGAHIALVLLHALAAAPPGVLGDDAGLPAILAVATLASACFSCARLLPASASSWRTALDALALIAVAYLSAASLSGPALVLAWTGEAIALAHLARRTGGQFALLASGCFLVAGALLTLTATAPPSALVQGPADLGTAAVTLTALGIAVLALGRAAALVGRVQIGGAIVPLTRARPVADAAGLLIAAYLSALALSQTEVVLTWMIVATALAALALRSRSQFALVASGNLLIAGAAVTLTTIAPPSALVYGADDLGAAAMTLAAMSITCVALGCAAIVVPVARLTELGVTTTRARALLWGYGGATVLLLVSVVVVSTFQPAPGQLLTTVLDLGVRQQGQVLLSALWSIVGLGGLIVGLRTRVAALRSAALALLLITAGKVFLYDLSTLDSIYRVTSFVVLGILLLTGAYAWQRLRPARPSGGR